MPVITEQQRGQHDGTMGVESRRESIGGLASLVRHGRVIRGAAGLRWPTTLPRILPSDRFPKAQRRKPWGRSQRRPAS
jgi:hypothetical protein